jgi:hypothetical protein
MTGKHEILENRISDHSIRNYKERFSLGSGDTINVRCAFGSYDPGIQETISARLLVGKVIRVKRGKVVAGIMLRLKTEEFATVARALADSGFPERREAFVRETRGLDGCVETEEGGIGGPPRLMKGSPMDAAFQQFFAREDNVFWDLCMRYFDHMVRRERRVYSFFISY